MFGVYDEFIKLAKENKKINVAIVGVGQMGRGLIAQFFSMPHRVICPVVIVDHQTSRVEKALLDNGILKDEYQVVTTAEQAEKTIASGKITVCSDDTVATSTKQVDMVIDVTGRLEAAANIAVNAISNKKHILMMTVETDVVVGTVLRHMAEEAGVIYSGMAGDEPGAIMELYDFAMTMGLEVLVLGKGKNNPVIPTANPDTAKEEAESKEMNPRMLASFQDCTKTMVELVAVANATGFSPDCLGGHGVVADTSNITEKYSSVQDGGVLNSYGVVDYAIGVAPGVFAIVTTKNMEIKKELKYVSLGDGPNYLLYRPYHLCSLEVPRTIIGMVVYGKSTIAPKLAVPTAEVITIAKRDLEIGEYLDEIGGYTISGSMSSYKDSQEKNAVPIGLITPSTVVKKAVKQGEIITYDHIEIDTSTTLYKLRQKQQEIFG